MKRGGRLTEAIENMPGWPAPSAGQPLEKYLTVLEWHRAKVAEWEREYADVFRPPTEPEGGGK